MKLSKSQVVEVLRLAGANTTTLVELAVRGGKDGDDDRGVYDDILYSVTPSDFQVWKHNTNPSSSYKKGLAELVPGLWPYVKGDHNITRPARRHRAFRQPSNVPFVVSRDGVGKDIGHFAINHHRGGSRGTSSLGCQTNSPEVWSEYLPWAYRVMGSSNTKQYLLLEADQVAKVLSGTHTISVNRDRSIWLPEKSKTTEAPKENYASKESWEIFGEDGSKYPGVVKVIAGRPIVRTRLAARWIDSFDPRDIEKTLEWDDEILALCGNRIDEVTMDDNGDTWAPLREITNAAGASISISKNKITVTAKK